MENNTAILLGLYRPNVDLEEVKALQKLGLELWAMNDFYMFYPFLMPDVIFQLHEPSTLPIDEIHGRWAACYREVYNACDCPVFQMYSDTGITKQVIINELSLYRIFPRELYQCTVIYQIAVAILCGYDSVLLRGMSFITDGERTSQVPFLVRAIDLAREKGLRVVVDEAVGAELAR